MTDVESSLVLPFAVIEREGGVAEEFPLEMTLATVLADIEKQRAKAGLLRRREEGLEFASLLYWPIVVVPWRENRHLVFDGMGVWSHVFSMGKIPDARSFAASVDAAFDYKAFLGLLQSRPTLFDAFPDAEQLPVMGLFIHEELMKDILSHSALAKPRQMRGSVLLTPRLSAEQTMEGVKKMRGLLDTMTASRDSLTVAGKAIERGLDRARRELTALRERTLQTYGNKIEGIRPDVTARVASLEKEREEQWKSGQPKLLELQALARKAEADAASWDTASRTQYGPESSAATQRAQAARQDLARARDQMVRCQQEMAESRTNYDRQVQAQWDRIREIERERDAEIVRLNQEEEAVVGLAGKLSTGVGGLLRNLDESMQFLVSQGVPAAVQDTTTVRMPIFVASLTSEAGRRFVVYPPMVARMGKGVLGGLKSTFGGAVLPLEPKTEHFEEIFRAGIEKAVTEDPSLSAYLTSLGNANNILHLGNLREMLGRGLAGLKAQGWIKDRHERELIVSLERHIVAAARTAPRAGP